MPDEFALAFETRDLEAALHAARKRELSLLEALDLVWLMRIHRHALYERAATRWIGRYLLETPSAGFQETRNAVIKMDGASEWVFEMRREIEAQNDESPQRRGDVGGS